VSIGVQLLKTRSATRERRASQARSDVVAAQDALRALRSAYRRHAFARRGAPDAFTLAEREDELDHVAALIPPENVTRLTRAYVVVGRLYAARDEDTGDASESHMYQKPGDALRAYLRSVG
jgi:hypothetical protein